MPCSHCISACALPHARCASCSSTSGRCIGCKDPHRYRVNPVTDKVRWACVRMCAQSRPKRVLASPHTRPSPTFSQCVPY